MGDEAESGASEAGQPYRSRPLGWLLQVIGWLALAAAFGIFALSRQRADLIMNSRVVTNLTFSVLGVIGSWIVVAGQKLAAIDGFTLMAQDPRPPVVYLRSFRDDDQVGAVGGAPFLGLQGSNDEQLLALALEPVGPFVAVGCPGERLASLGAARLYVSDAEWHDVVGGLLRKASLVLLRAGLTEGFWWEVERVVRSVEPTRLVIFLASWMMDSEGELRERTYQAFRERAKGFLPCELPASGGGASLLAFGPDWTPRLLVVDANLKDAARYGPSGMIQLALRPVLEPLGFAQAAAPPMISRGFKVGLLVVGLLLAALVVFTVMNVGHTGV